MAGAAFTPDGAAGPLEISGRAAVAVHDARLGGTGVFHLFRLPISLEAGMHDVLARDGVKLGAFVQSAKHDDALQMLGDLAGSEPTRVPRISTAVARGATAEPRHAAIAIESPAPQLSPRPRVLLLALRPREREVG